MSVTTVWEPWQLRNRDTNYERFWKRICLQMLSCSSFCSCSNSFAHQIQYPHLAQTYTQRTVPTVLTVGLSLSVPPSLFLLSIPLFEVSLSRCWLQHQLCSNGGGQRWVWVSLSNSGVMCQVGCSIWQGLSAHWLRVLVSGWAEIA